MQVALREWRPEDARECRCHITEAAIRFQVQPAGLLMASINRLLAHPQDLTGASQLASCARGCSFADILMLSHAR
jgi:hypothetical protein